PPPGGADRRRGGDARRGAREATRGPRVPPWLRAPSHRAARRAPAPGAVGRVAHTSARARSRGAPRAGRRARDARRARADGAERLALRLAVGAARERGVLSWPRVDIEQARPRVPSFYGLEALRAASGRLPGFDELEARGGDRTGGRLGWPAPQRPADAIDEAEYDLALLAGLRDADPATTDGSARYLLDANVHLGRALRARGRRWLRRWTPAD